MNNLTSLLLIVICFSSRLNVVFEINYTTDLPLAPRKEGGLVFAANKSYDILSYLLIKNLKFPTLAPSQGGGIGFCGK